MQADRPRHKTSGGALYLWWRRRSTRHHSRDIVYTVEAGSLPLSETCYDPPLDYWTIGHVPWGVSSTHSGLIFVRFQADNK